MRRFPVINGNDRHHGPALDGSGPRRPVFPEVQHVVRQDPRRPGPPSGLGDHDRQLGEQVRDLAAPSENVPAYIQVGRDFIVGEIPEGYEPYSYPHPARGLADSRTCLTDDHSYAKTGITFFSSGPEPDAPDVPDDSGEPSIDASTDGSGDLADEGFLDDVADTAVDGAGEGDVLQDGGDEGAEGNGGAGSGCSCTLAWT
jgi:hypothetical protein